MTRRRSPVTDASRPRPRRPQARRPGRPLRTRVRARLPGRARSLALLLAVAFGGGLTYIVAGPVFRVEEVVHAGTRFTAASEVEQRLADVANQSLLALDTGALERRLRALPGVESVTVEAALPGRVSVTIDEADPVLIWQTPRARLAVTADGGVVAELAPGAAPPADLAQLPVIDDARAGAEAIAVGQRLDGIETAAALRLATLDPALLGSAAPGLAVRIDELFGFTLVTDGWQGALGYYGREPGDDATTVAARIERQVTAIRTLFAGRPEASVVWVDARNPGKIYFRATEG